MGKGGENGMARDPYFPMRPTPHGVQNGAIGSFAIGAKLGRSGGSRELLHDDENHQRGLEPKRPALLELDTMTFSIRTHDSWGVVPVGDFQSIEEAGRYSLISAKTPGTKPTAA
jgi:hypothetical protein